MNNQPTLVMIPCFSGAAWQLNQLTELKNYNMRTFCLPNDINKIEELADFIIDQVIDLDNYVLVGDSYGAIAAIAVAIRQPKGLTGLVISGGFAKSPITSPLLKFLSMLAPFISGPFYRQLTLRFHAAELASSFDKEGEIPWSTNLSRDLFIKSTPHKAYINRIQSIEEINYISLLGNILIPTLILTPDEDKLIGEEASKTLLKNIKNSEEVIIKRTGHMFRFSHPFKYSLEIKKFLKKYQM